MHAVTWNLVRQVWKVLYCLKAVKLMKGLFFFAFFRVMIRVGLFLKEKLQVVPTYTFCSKSFQKSLQPEKSDTNSVFLTWKFPSKILVVCSIQLLISRYLWSEINSCTWPAPRILAGNLIFHNNNKVFVSDFFILVCIQMVSLTLSN